MTNADDNWQLEGGCIADGWVKPESNADDVTEGTYVDRLSINEERVPQPPGRLISSTPIRRTDDVTEGLARELESTPLGLYPAPGWERAKMLMDAANAILAGPTVRELQAREADACAEVVHHIALDWSQQDETANVRVGRQEAERIEGYLRTRAATYREAGE